MSEIDNTVSGEAGASVPEGVVRQVVSAAERGDRFAFAVAANRVGSLEEAQAIVRSRGIVRTVDRYVSVAEPLEVADSIELRDASAAEGDAGPVMFGHFAVFNDWTEINSYFEGNFLERIAPRAFNKTFREQGSDMRALFQHGADPQIGDKPLGTIDVLREDDTGAYYEVSLLDAGYVRGDILPGLQAGLYGASFRFQTMREDFVDQPPVSETNPKGLPERTLKELRVFEFGPVTFPAYPAATAGVRAGATQDEGEVEAVTAPVTESAETNDHHTAGVAGSESHPARTRREPIYGLNRKEIPSWQL